MKFCNYPIELVLVIFATIFTKATHSISPPPKLYSIIPDAPFHNLRQNFSSQPNYDVNSLGDDESVPYALSIHEGSSIDVEVNSVSSFQVSLSRAIPQDINVTVQVYSGASLISFGTDHGHNNTNYTITFKANTFGDRNVLFYTKDLAGHAEVVCRIAQQPKGIVIDDSSAYFSVNIGKSSELNLLISIVGWIYFAAWSLSFYFQVILNYQRKSVIGLNFDFLALNLLGFTCYTIYNFALMFSREVQENYYARNAYSRIPVEYNDLFFAVHAVVVTLATIIQCFIYERGEQKVSISAGSLVALASTAGVILYVIYLFNQVAILDVVLYLSYVKLAVTLIKYTPQAYMNYARKATTGWSIYNILLDFTGGLFSIAQMFIIAYNFDDWISIFGNFTKFGLGVISIAFDLLFVTQHYILYRQTGQLDVSVDSVPSPVISETLRSASHLGDANSSRNNVNTSDNENSEA